MKKYEEYIKIDLGSGASRREGSSPFIRTIK